MSLHRILVALLGLVGAVSPAAAADVAHHRIEATLDPARARLEVTDTVEVSAPGDEALSFLLHRDLVLASVSREDGTAVPVETLGRWQPREFWARPPFDALAPFGIARHHRLEAPAEGWPDPVRLTFRFSGAVHDSLQAPEVAYGRGFETTSGLIDPRGAYLFGQTFWLPWFGPEDLFGFELTTDLPTDWHSMSQGARVRHHARDGRNRTTWRETLPMGEVFLIAGPYTIRERDHRGIQIATYTYADTPDSLCATYLDATGEYLDRYAAEYGPYPFAKFAMVENWWQTGYGMPSFTFLGDKVIRLPFIVHTSYGHEILHNWWGNGVYVEAGEGNWCEGLTTYGADYAYKEDESPAAARNHRRDALAAYRDHVVAGGRDFALRDFRERADFATQAVGYGKTMMLFHMLRQRVGDDAFRDGLRLLYRTHLGREAGWSDVAAAFGEVARVPEAWFTQWVDRPGALDLSVTVEGGRIELRQNGEPYRVRVPYTWSDGEGDHAGTVDLEGASTTLDLPRGATRIAFDPDFHLFRRLHRAEIPASLSQTLGATRTAIVVGADTSAEVGEALRAVATEWAQRGDVDWTDEGGPLAPGAARFLLGEGPLARAALEAAATVDASVRQIVDRARAEGLSLVVATRDPDDPELGWTVVLPADAGVVPALARKLPHYGRYGYLVFDGERNVDKGSWQPRTSPLTLDLEESR